MERRTRVYPAERRRSGWLSMVLLCVSAVVIAAGFLSRGSKTELQIEPVLKSTPLPMEESFDETPAQQEIVLSSSEWYALQLGAFENEAAAQELAEQYKLRGAAGYVWQDGRFRVLAAVYPLKEDAQLVREQLAVRHDIETYLYQVKLPEIHVRLSGMQGQLDILQAALIHANDLVCELQQMSLELDRQEMNVEEALETLGTLEEQVSLVSLRLNQRFSAPRHALVERLDHCFTQYGSFVLALDARMSQAALAAQIKHQTFTALENVKKVYDTLSDT